MLARSLKHLGTRSSGLALIGASAVLLAATGESMWHAHAATLEGRWAGPMAGVAAIAEVNEAAVVPSANATSSTSSTSPASSERRESSAANSVTGLFYTAGNAGERSEVADPPIPRKDFKPFVRVRIPYDPSIYPDGGEVLGVSNNGTGGNAIAVGYLRDDPAAAPQPFMFVAATNTLTMLDMDEGAYDYGVATSISPDGSIIAGWAYHTSSSKMKAVVWEAPYDEIDASLSPATDSYWNAINDSGVPVGAYWDTDHFESVVGTQTAGYPYSGSEGETKGINASDVVCGWYINTSDQIRAYRWDSSSGGLNLQHPTGQGYGDESGANCINGTNDIGGWVTNEYGSHIATHWKPLTPPGVAYQSIILGNGNDSNYEVVAINSNREMLINRVDSVPGIAIWINNSLANEAVVIDGPHGVLSDEHRILMPNPDDHIYNGFCLNDDLWIGGSYLVNGEGLPRPCLAVPYDINNNEVPDFREIIESGVNGTYSHHADTYGFAWLIDVGENITPNGDGIRIGLNGPGYADAYSDDIANTQVVRLPLGLHNPDFVTGTIGDDEYYVNGIVYTGGTSQCGPFQTGLNKWREGREIILTLRSNLDDEDPDHDYLPTAPNVDLGENVTKAHVLANLHRFSYNFSRCADWIQLGNEVFSSSSGTYAGHGGYKIWAEEVGDCWTGADPREFEDIPLGTCFAPALAAVQAWHHEQMWSILEGSALAGRPLRIVGPGMTSAAVINGYDQGITNKRWNQIEQTILWCNERQAWFDVHNRYRSVTEGEGIINALFTFGQNQQPWAAIRHLVCLELAPKLNPAIDWWTGGGDDLFYALMGDPECDSGNGTWDTFISDWEDAQFNSDFGVDTMISDLRFDAAGFTVACYGSTLQLAAADPLWDLAALRAQNACAENFQHNPEQFSPLKGHYESAAEPYQIDEFDPHENACSSCGEN